MLKFATALPYKKLQRSGVATLWAHPQHPQLSSHPRESHLSRGQEKCFRMRCKQCINNGPQRYAFVPMKFPKTIENQHKVDTLLGNIALEATKQQRSDSRTSDVPVQAEFPESNEMQLRE